VNVWSVPDGVVSCLSPFVMSSRFPCQLEPHRGVISPHAPAAVSARISILHLIGQAIPLGTSVNSPYRFFALLLKSQCARYSKGRTSISLRCIGVADTWTILYHDCGSPEFEILSPISLPHWEATPLPLLTRVPVTLPLCYLGLFVWSVFSLFRFPMIFFFCDMAPFLPWDTIPV